MAELNKLDKALEHLKNVTVKDEIYDEVKYRFLNKFENDLSYTTDQMADDILSIQPLDIQTYLEDVNHGLFAAARDNDLYFNVPFGVYPGISDYTSGFTMRMHPGETIPYFMVSPETDPSASSTLLHEIEHGVLNKNRPDIEYMDEPQTFVFEEAGGNAEKFREGFELVAPYLEQKYGFVLQPSLSENLTELSAVEQIAGVDFTDDPFLKKNLFKNHSDRVAYRSTSGLRKTRLDAKDLEQYKPVPEGDYTIWQRIKEAVTPSTYKLPKQPTAGIGEPILVDMDDPLYNNPLLQDPFN